jgi:hypothetical protein
MTQTGQQFGQQGQFGQTPFIQQQPVRGNYSRTEQNFYRGQPGSNIRPEPSYPQGQSQMQQYAGGMGVLNYNAFSQKEYDELKEQFFRPPMSRPLEPYNRMSEGTKSPIQTQFSTLDR